MARRKKKKKKKEPKEKKLTTAQKKARRKRRKETMIIFINGKQKRVKRPPTIDGLPEEEFLLQNADPIFLAQNEMWEYLDAGEGNLRYDASNESDVPSDEDEFKEEKAIRPGDFSIGDLPSDDHGIPF